MDANAKPGVNERQVQVAALVRAKVAADKRATIEELVDRYLLALDEGVFSEAFAREVFTEDVILNFPPGSHRGIAGLAEFTDGFMGHWAATHHHASNYLIELNGDRVTVTGRAIMVFDGTLTSAANPS